MMLWVNVWNVKMDSSLTCPFLIFVFKTPNSWWQIKEQRAYIKQRIWNNKWCMSQTSWTNVGTLIPFSYRWCLDRNGYVQIWFSEFSCPKSQAINILVIWYISLSAHDLFSVQLVDHIGGYCAAIWSRKKTCNIQCFQNIFKTSQNPGCNEFQPIVPPLSIWLPYACHLDRTAMCEVDGIGPVPSGPQKVWLTLLPFPHFLFVGGWQLLDKVSDSDGSKG